MLILYTLTLFVSASLLFVVQPMFTRLAVPLLGGSPAVWNVGQAFFQAALLCGYAYAYASNRWLKSRWQIVLHLILALTPLALLILPIRIPAGWTPPTDSNPLPWLLALLTLAVGLPFFVLAASTPLLQQWFTRSGHPAAADPYFLYAASNAGSLLALLSYPVLIEPTLRLTEQSWLWAAGYVLLIGLVAACGIMLWRHEQTRDHQTSTPDVQETSTAEAERPALTRGRRIRWVLLALAPVSLMLSVVTHISTDIASIPLLWIIPLAIYLLTFILVFARKPPLPHIWMVRIAPFAALALVWIVAAKPSSAVALPLIPVQLLAFFIISMVCHGELALDRPRASDLTEFYLWLSVGGVLGGVFNALVAPLIFNTVAEYPITLVLIGLLLPKPPQRETKLSEREQRQKARARIMPEIPKKYLWLLDIGLAVVVFGLTAVIAPGGSALLFLLPVFICLAFLRRPLRFGLGVAAILLAGALFITQGGQLLYEKRSFFGVHRVYVLEGQTHHVLTNGNTLHGAESLNPAWRKVPLTYYYPTGPLGQIFETLKDDPAKRNVAVIGLGAGSTACYAQPGGVKLPQQDFSSSPSETSSVDNSVPGPPWTFYEIDPVVEQIARDTRYFSFLHDCAPDAKVVLGDGRLSLASAPQGAYNLIILDAFNSDAVPVHLLTREAMQVYLDKLAPGGHLVFHITSRHFVLDTVLGNLAQDAGLIARIRTEADSDINQFDAFQGKQHSKWAVVVRDIADLGDLANDPRWVTPDVPPDARVWTDDFSSLLSVLK